MIYHGTVYEEELLLSINMALTSYWKESFKNVQFQKFQIVNIKVD